MLREFPVYKRLGITIERGEGVHVFDDAGRSYLDLYGGHATAVLGYGHPALLDALSHQARTLFFQSNAVDVPVRREALDALGAIAPEGLTAAFFVNSGAEANENALRLALRITGRPVVVALEHAFHGRTAAAAACTAGSEPWYGFPQRPFEVRVVPRDDPAALRAAVDHNVAAVIAEPVQGVAGAVALDRPFLRAVREACDAAGALFIADEVQSGMGRSGAPFAVQRAQVAPDLLTMGKGLAGGFPAAGILARPAIAEACHAGDLGSTFGGGPLAMALVAAVARTLVAEDLCANARARFEQIAAECVRGPVTEVQGAGLLVGLRTTRRAAEVVAGLREHGIITGGAADPHVVRLLPPLTIGPEHVQQLAVALEAL